MRFQEFNQDKDLESALVNTLLNMQGDADEKDQSSEISFDAVQSLMTNTGYPAFNYDARNGGGEAIVIQTKAKNIQLIKFDPEIRINVFSIMIFFYYGYILWVFKN